jgi:hypothetical protein
MNRTGPFVKASLVSKAEIGGKSAFFTGFLAPDRAAASLAAEFSSPYRYWGHSGQP